MFADIVAEAKDCSGIETIRESNLTRGRLDLG